MSAASKFATITLIITTIAGYDGSNLSKSWVCTWIKVLIEGIFLHKKIQT